LGKSNCHAIKKGKHKNKKNKDENSFDFGKILTLKKNFDFEKKISKSKSRPKIFFWIFKKLIMFGEAGGKSVFFPLRDV
jgi:hypothetical protein